MGDRISQSLAHSRFVSKVVLLALDGVVGADGNVAEPVRDGLGHAQGAAPIQGLHPPSRIRDSGARQLLTAGRANARTALSSKSFENYTTRAREVN